MSQLPFEDPSYLSHLDSRAGRVFWGELVGFYAQAPETLIVVREGLVLDASVSAKAAGVVPGMSIQNARSLVPNIVLRPWQSDEYLERQRTWLDVCAEFSGTVEPEDQHTAFIDLSLHPDALDVADRLVQALANKTGLEIRFGMAPIKWVAKLAANVDRNLSLACADPAAFLNPLPVGMLLPATLEQRERLRFLGCKTIGEVAKMPLKTLTRQFGQAGIALHQAALGGGVEPIHALYPPKTISDCYFFESPVSDLLILDRTLCLLAKRLSDRLVERDSQGARLQAVVEYETAPRTIRKRRFTKPICCFASALSSMRLLLESAWTDAVTSIRVVLADVQRCSGAQIKLLSSGSRPEIKDSLYHVRTVFGDRSVQLGSEVLPPRRVQVLREWKNATGWR